MPSRNVLALLALLALVVIAATVLSTIGADVPAWFDKLAFVLAGGSAGVATPKSTKEG